LDFDKNLSTNAHNFSIILRVNHKKLNFQHQKKKSCLKKYWKLNKTLYILALVDVNFIKIREELTSG
jgi:hypothetical protein